MPIRDNDRLGSHEPPLLALHFVAPPPSRRIWMGGGTSWSPLPALTSKFHTVKGSTQLAPTLLNICAAAYEY